MQDPDLKGLRERRLAEMNEQAPYGRGSDENSQEKAEAQRYCTVTIEVGVLTVCIYTSACLSISYSIKKSESLDHY
jgi:hypothetical protein